MPGISQVRQSAFLLNHKTNYSIQIQLNHVLVPVTAAAIVESGLKTLLIVGEGRRLKVFDNESHQVICILQIFQSQVVHGVQCQWDAKRGHLVCLVWGGRAITVLHLKFDTSDFCVVSLTEELLTDDWISDACFLTNARISTGDPSSLPQAIFLTSHNILYTLLSESSPPSQDPGKLSCKLIAAGPTSVLYSANVVVLANGEAFIAAGTVFGEVLVWSSNLAADHNDSGGSKSASLLHTFRGHEGSVFGVTIAATPSTVDHGLSSCVVASCSDDRTIRMWDLSCAAGSSTRASIKTGFRSQPMATEIDSEHCVASIMGHLSRIWSLRFLSYSNEAVRWISFGEDSTAQTWQLVRKLARGTSTSTKKPPSYEIQHDESYAYHVGKDIWAAAVDLQDPVCLILTGGADGRAVSYNIPNADVQRWTADITLLQEETVKRGPVSCGASTDDLSQRLSPAERAFSAIQGRWHLHRVLESAIPTYPSGSFTGTATLTQRLPTNEDYDAEYLYVEEGELITRHGLVMRGSRRYAYRLQKAARAITAWFVKTDVVSSVDYLFHQVEFGDFPCQIPKDESFPVDSMSTAKGYHLCVNDDYVAEYEFQYEGTALSQWNLKYKVKGPKKDYTASAHYTRTSKVDNLLAENMNTVEEGDLAHGRKRDIGMDTLKNYCWIGCSEVITTTARGYIFLGTLDRNNTTGSLRAPADVTGATKPKTFSWCLVDRIPELHSYSIAVSISNHTVIVGAANGSLYCYQRSSQEIRIFPKLARKISGLFAGELESSKETHRNVAAIACCVGDATAYYFSFITKDAKLKDVSNFVKLTLPPNFIVTSVCFTAVEDLLILGSRSGAVCFYDRSLFHSTGPIPACCVIQQIHVDDAVTTIKTVPKDDSEIIGNFLLTAGRDGKFALHRVHTRREEGQYTIKLERLHTTVPPFGPNIEGACFDSENQDLLLWGFRSTDFVVWNETKRIEVMKVPCGGAHRSWAYLPSNDGQNGGVFIWTKAANCNVQAQSKASHRVLQPGGHGREIKAMAICPLKMKFGSDYGHLVATGAEDTMIRISFATGNKVDSSQAMRCLGVISKHNTGIQQLQWSSDGRFLFSAAGLEEFYVWRIQRVPCLGIGFVCNSQCPKVTESSDLRIMSFDVQTVLGDVKMQHDKCVVSIAYSNSTVRLWSLDASTSGQGFKLLSFGTYTSCCLTQIKLFQLGLKPYLLTAGTDGYIAFWPVRTLQEQVESRFNLPEHHSGPSAESFDSDLNWNCRYRIHQSSIKCLTFHYLPDGGVIIATGGDDNAVAFTHISCNTGSPNLPICSTLLLTRAHASTVTGIQCFNSRLGTDGSDGRTLWNFATVGNDQWLKSWILTIDSRKRGAAGLSVCKGTRSYSSVADGSCMQITPEGYGETRRVMVAGIGVETWNVTDV
ncbi:hypothetical protein MMC18_003462 [Xylographa bjoerkii]|nr:hypothetical protein [Xylographa bjoerkii]